MGGGGKKQGKKGGAQGQSGHRTRLESAIRTAKASSAAQTRHSAFAAASMSSGPGSRRPSGQTQGKSLRTPL
jgi:hypothetical protein